MGCMNNQNGSNDPFGLRARDNVAFTQPDVVSASVLRVADVLAWSSTSRLRRGGDALRADAAGKRDQQEQDAPEPPHDLPLAITVRYIRPLSAATIATSHLDKGNQ